MKPTLGAIGSIASISAMVFFNFHHSTLALVCAFTGILFFIILVCLHIKDRNAEKNQALPQRPMGVGTDDNTRLIIKAISDETNGFVTLADIVRYTDLPLKRINKTLDWLFIHKFATEIKVRHGKAYILTPEGKSTFSQLIKENINKPST